MRLFVTLCALTVSAVPTQVECSADITSSEIRVNQEKSSASAKKQDPKKADKEKKDKAKATFKVNANAHQLKHVVAFEGYWFDEKAPIVLITEKPVSVEKLAAAVKKGFDAQELHLLSMGRHLRFRYTDKDELDKPTVGGWADNLSLGSSSDLKAKAEIKDGRIKGAVAMKKPDSLGPFTYHFDAEFDVKIRKFGD